MFVFAILKLTYGYTLLEDGGIPCMLYSIITIFNTRLEITTIGYLAMMRYLIVCYNIKKSKKFWIILYFAIMILAFSFYLYPLAILDVSPSPSMLVCANFIKPKPTTYVLSFINPFIILIPCCISTFSYFMIGIKAFKKLNQMKKDALATNDSELVVRLISQKRSLIFQLLVVFVVFNLSYMPIYITIILRVTAGYKRTPFADAIMTELIEVSRVIDPIITIIFQPELNHEFQVIITKFRAKFKTFIAKIFKKITM
jgi:hypothetical protein